MKLNDSLGYKLNIAAKLMKRDLDNRLTQYHITTNQWAIMKILSEQGELTQVEITKLLNSDQATCGSVIERMVKRKLLQKRAHDIDRRAYKVSLTNYGKSIIDELEEQAIITNTHALKGISEEEKREFYRIIQQIINNIEER